MTVHPHGRGEHGLWLKTDAGHGGSSPRAWGTPDLLGDQRGQERFIPTGVGNTSAHETAARGCTVHPHGRGEHGRLGRQPGRAGGSSPRAWGTRRHDYLRMVCRRFIPTGVGNTSSARAHSGASPVHPHGRGEHALSPTMSPRSFGSSPRAWGTLKRRARVIQSARFIPTGVGNTRPSRRSTGSETVHPHGRGEHRLEALVAALSAGSSPRAWGTLRGVSPQGLHLRFIPTGVGNTT